MFKKDSTLLSKGTGLVISSSPFKISICFLSNHYFCISLVDDKLSTGGGGDNDGVHVFKDGSAC